MITILNDLNNTGLIFNYFAKKFQKYNRLVNWIFICGKNCSHLKDKCLYFHWMSILLKRYKKNLLIGKYIYNFSIHVFSKNQNLKDSLKHVSIKRSRIIMNHSICIQFAYNNKFTTFLTCSKISEYDSKSSECIILINCSEMSIL